MNENAKKRITMITELRNAVKRNEFLLYYQPQIDLTNKNYVGVEALIRWKCEALGMVMPNVFIPLAEETGLIFEIGEWVLKTACLQARKWYDSGYNNLKIGVNVSPVQFRDDKLVESIKFILAETGLPPELLELEVTESIFIDDTKSTVDKLSQLRKIGVKIAVDDFGTGYSSLSYIKDLPIDKLKIDRSFIKEIPVQDNGTIANIIINLAHSLNIGVTAEGVETTEQEQFLIEKSCSEAQGYYYSRPIPADELMRKLNIE
jgi:EAL domain-containing protein (putative c-di-GMP-specific phosphodiesterase class I)